MAPVGIIGDGAIGRLIASRLRCQDWPVLLAGRQHPKNTPVCLWLICTKSYQVAEAVATLDTQTPLVLLSNGLGPHQQLALRPNPLYLGTTTYGARRQGNDVELTGRGHCDYGHYAGHSRHLPLVHTVLNAALPPARQHLVVMPALLRKLAINAVINPLTARDGVSNGALLAEHYCQEIQTLVDQMQPVLHGLGLPDNNAALSAQLYRVVANTAANHSSMLQDITNGRKTEIDSITGYLCQQAQQQHLPVPAHQALLEIIKDLAND